MIPKIALPLPAPPRLDKLPAVPLGEERRTVDNSRGVSSDDKL